MVDDPKKSTQEIDDWDSLPLDESADDWDSPVSDGPVSSLESQEFGAVSEEKETAVPIAEANEAESDDWDKDELGSLEPEIPEILDPEKAGVAESFELSDVEKETVAKEEDVSDLDTDDKSKVGLNDLDSDDWNTTEPEEFKNPQPEPKPNEPEKPTVVKSASEKPPVSVPKKSLNLDDEEIDPELPPSALDDPLGLKNLQIPSKDKPKPGKESDDRDEFLKGLLDDEDDSVPKKVELDLDGIFSEDQESPDDLSPDTTHLPVAAPEEAPAEVPPEPVVEPPEDTGPPEVRRIPKTKLILLVLPIVVGVFGLSFGVYQIFLKSPPPVEEETSVVYEAVPLQESRELEPGEMTLPRFYLELIGPKEVMVAEMEIIIHYHDTPDASIIEEQMVIIRDLIYRLTVSSGPAILTDVEARQKLQAVILRTLNELAPFKSDPDKPRLTYIQISLLRRR